MYLLEDSPEAQDMRQNVYNLLISDDEDNTVLAMQLIDGGGVHKDFLAPLAMHTIRYWWGYNSGLKKNPLQYLKQILDNKQIAYLRRRVHHGHFWNSYLPHIVKSDKISFWKELAVCAFYYSSRTDASILCCQYNLVPSEKIFSEQIQQGYLGLWGYKLEDLPDGFAKLDITHLNLSDCSLAHIKRKKWTNISVTTVQYTANLSYFACHVIGKCFPTFFKKLYNNKNETYRLNTGFMKCMPQAERDLKFYKRCAELYKKEGNYLMAIKFYTYLNKKYPYSEEIFIFKIAGCYALLKNKEKMLEYLRLHLQENSFEEVAKQDFLQSPDFKGHWKNKEVARLWKNKDHKSS